MSVDFAYGHAFHVGAELPLCGPMWKPLGIEGTVYAQNVDLPRLPYSLACQTCAATLRVLLDRRGDSNA